MAEVGVAVGVSDGDRRQKIFNKVVAIAAEQMGVEKSAVTEAVRFADDLNADSLDQVELIMEFENTFGISIPEEKATAIKSVGDAVTFLYEYTDAEK